jgi:hypothetical protein
VEGRYYLTRLGAMLAERLKTVATSTVEAAVVADVFEMQVV